MSAPPSLPDPALASSAPSSDERMLRNLLLAGVAAIVGIWTLETVGAQITSWDRMAYPAMMVAFGAGAAVLTWRPRWTSAVRVATVATFNGYLVMSLHMVLYIDPASTSMYQLVSNLYWLPLGYATAFVFLAKRAALVLSGVLYASTFGPILWSLHAGATPAAWPADVPPIMNNLAVAQVVYVVLMLAISQLRQDMRQTRERAWAMQQVATTDALTGLSNRRALGEHLDSGIALARRGAQPMSVLLIDVDHFKLVNDTRGHAVGDAVLVELAALLADQLRSSDRIGRWGGEEFLVVAPATGAQAALDLAERMRGAVADHSFDHGLAVTISLGVATSRPTDDVDLLLGRADTALYVAKQRGRNRAHGLAVAPASLQDSRSPGLTFGGTAGSNRSSIPDRTG